MIKVLAGKREGPKVREFFEDLNILFEIHTSLDTVSLDPFELGVSYNFLCKVQPPLLYLARKGFINYHPAPLPQYPSGPGYALSTSERAIQDRVMRWGVTLHYMDEEYDNGPIIRKVMFDLEEPPLTRDEIGSITHWHMWKLFKSTILDIYHFGNPTNIEFIEQFNLASASSSHS
jgi:folate-dependent phosphoribosylglycinamide formyltransferase PurN